MRDSMISALLEPLLASHGLELDALDVVPAGKRRLVKVRVDGDGPNGHGPDLDQISEVTRVVSQALDDADAMGEQPYTLEVSSRGATTPLTKPAHYRRNSGRLVKLALSDADPLTGRIVAADDDAVSLTPQVETLSGKHKSLVGAGQPIRVEYDRITKAVIQLELNRADDSDDASPDDFDDAVDIDDGADKE